ncbi:hypothetical protein [Archangium primigenium]|uniref:hypothetical protein n=1 Tax=[Archangium] primigenium TaxID=2792470 RepID=UPI00195D0098|nr:hypothetical protein [Archangium primigenium]MBM7112917.1 hypothetical protein [Archangium primigenium]
MSDMLFSSEVETVDTRHLGRLWVADVLDLALSALLGWGALRALEVDRTPVTLVAAGCGVWFFMSALGALSGWSLGRGLVGLRLIREGGAPGLGRGVLRAPLVPVDLLLSLPLQRRPLDRLLGVFPEAVPLEPRAWRGGLGWMGLWLVLGGLAGVFLVKPTRGESLKYLKTLDGWRCCHGQWAPTVDKCAPALARAVSEARSGHARAQAVVADCPKAAEVLR